MTHASGLAGRVALVTGSSRGIGEAIATLFAQHGARVAVHGRDERALAGVQARIEASGGTAMRTVADITRFDDIERMRREIEQKLGPVDTTRRDIIAGRPPRAPGVAHSLRGGEGGNPDSLSGCCDAGGAVRHSRQLYCP